MGGPLYNDPTNPRAYVELIIGLVLLSLTWVAICVRFFVRYRKQSLGLDDYFALICQIFYTIFIATYLLLHEFVPGAQPKTDHDAELYFIWLIVCAIMYGWCMIFLKLSLGVFFLRILISHRQRCMVYVVMVLSVAMNLIDTFWNIFSCGDPRFYYDHIVAGKCASTAWGLAESYAQTIVNTGTDIALACLPFFLLRDSMMATSAKLSVAFILILATTGCICGIVVLAYIPDYYNNADLFRSIVKVGIIREVEVGTGILAGSLATMRPLLSSIVTSIKPLYSLSNRISRKSGPTLNTITINEVEEPNITPAPSQMAFQNPLCTVPGVIDPLPNMDEKVETKPMDMIEVRSVKIGEPQTATDEKFS